MHSQLLSQSQDRALVGKSKVGIFWWMNQTIYILMNFLHNKNNPFFLFCVGV
jgi:hypothetical protein